MKRILNFFARIIKAVIPIIRKYAPQLKKASPIIAMVVLAIELIDRSEMLNYIG